MSGKVKATCLNCRYRRSIPGDAHSACHTMGDPLAATQDIFKKILHGTPLPSFPTFDKHGVEAGWVHWPMNFDPVWLISCPYWRLKETENAEA